VVARWVENPCWQFLSGFVDIRWQLPCDPTMMSKQASNGSTNKAGSGRWVELRLGDGGILVLDNP